MYEMRRKDRVAIVTGACRRIDEGYVKALAREGTKVVEVDTEHGERVAKEIPAAGGDSRFVKFKMRP
jgi:NAD(P)-dependent dehydrogenase (short-subunit alcohol dehydrogenase family)